MKNTKRLTDEIVSLLPEFYKLFIKPFELIGRETVTGTQLFVLNILQNNGRSAMTDIANMLQISKQQLTVIVDKLEKMNFVVRIHNDKDRRKIEVEITEDGNSFMRDTRERMCEVNEERLSVLSKEEKLELIRSVQTVKEIMIKIDNSERL